MRLKHGHFCNITVEAGGVAQGPYGPERPCFHLSFENLANSPQAQADGLGHLQRLIHAYDAGEALPVDALAQLIDALRAFGAGGDLELQLKQFALHAGLDNGHAGTPMAANGPEMQPLPTF